MLSSVKGERVMVESFFNKAKLKHNYPQQGFVSQEKRVDENIRGHLVNMVHHTGVK